MDFQKEYTWTLDFLGKEYAEDALEDYKQAYSLVDCYLNKASEKVEFIFENVQEYLILTNKRMINIGKVDALVTNVVSSFPYSRVMFYETEAIKEADEFSIMPSLKLVFINGFVATLNFQDYQGGVYEPYEIEQLITSAMM